jgi:glycosyltransferase involved in cell wall biosynthesis
MPAVLSGRGLVTVSTVQTNMPVNAKVYGPEVRTTLSYLGGDPAVTEELTDPPLPPEVREFLPAALLYDDYPARPGHDYISLLGLVARSAHALDFLSSGQLEHALTQADSPFEQVFERFAARRELLARRDRLVVGGCAIGDEWLDLRRSDDQRKQALTALGLDPALPAVYHNARYTVQHKGQQEMFRALLRLLDEGERFNALLHCLAPRPPADPGIDALTRRYPDFIRIRTGPMTQQELIGWATASDLCLFPSKFEMDTFLMAMGEAMAAGAVPIATAQRGMQHFGHAFDLDDPAATGLALPRSFRIDDPVLTEAICTGLRQMLGIVRNDPARIETLRDKAIAVARQFTWQRTADRFLDIFRNLGA